MTLTIARRCRRDRHKDSRSGKAGEESTQGERDIRKAGKGREKKERDRINPSGEKTGKNRKSRSDRKTVGGKEERSNEHGGRKA